MRIFTLSLAIFLASVSFAAAKPKEICGVIKRFACADNCYLTIETKQGEVDGLYMYTQRGYGLIVATPT